MEVSGLLHDPAAILQGKNSLRPLDRRLGGPRDILDTAILKRKIPSPTGNGILKPNWKNNDSITNINLFST
jgi:hypothetical protein